MKNIWVLGSNEKLKNEFCNLFNAGQENYRAVNYKHGNELDYETAILVTGKDDYQNSLNNLALAFLRIKNIQKIIIYFDQYDEKTFGLFEKIVVHYGYGDAYVYTGNLEKKLLFVDEIKRECNKLSLLRDKERRDSLSWQEKMIDLNAYFMQDSLEVVKLERKLVNKN